MVTVSCALCGTPAPGGTGDGAESGGPPLTWVYEFDSRRGGSWICPDCARTNLRSMEAGLDREDW